MTRDLLGRVNGYDLRDGNQLAFYTQCVQNVANAIRIAAETGEGGVLCHRCGSVNWSADDCGFWYKFLGPGSTRTLGAHCYNCMDDHNDWPGGDR